ncbi:ABC transporter permease [Oscillospiraceae bacterium]|nr:ABC transporter permease [Oscillospiraceae bacterium]
MKSYLALTWKELKTQKITATLILIAVIMSTIITTVVGQSIGILQSMRIEQAASLNGNRYVTFHQLSREQAQKLHEDDRVYDVGDTVFVGSTTLGNSSLNLYLREYHDNALAMYPAISKIKEGHLPEKASEIALSEDSLRYLGLDAAVGDTVSLDMRVSVMDGSLPEFEYCGKFILTGILESSYIGYSTGTVEGIVGNGTAEKLLPEKYLLYSTDFKTHDKKNFQSIVYDLAKNLDVEDRYIQYNWILLDAVGISYDETSNSDAGAGFSFMTVACVLVGLLVLFAAGLVIYNILKISITKRIKEYGTLRAIGGERGQIYRLVSLQLLILCGIGIPIGLVLGTLAAKATLIAATGALNPDIFMANSVSELNEAISVASTVKFPMLLASIAVTLLFALMAAFPAARYASRVSPTVAMSGQSVKIKRRRKRNHKIYNFEAYYARLNLKRGRGRTLLTILSLVMSITVFVALQSFTGLLDASSSVQDMYSGDYAITNEIVGIPAEAVKTLEANDAVETISTTQLSVFMPGAGDLLPFETDLSVQSHETLQLASVDEGQLRTYAPDLSEKDKQALNEGTGCLIQNPIAFSYGDTSIQQTSLAVGDTIRLGDKTVRVVGLTDTPVIINNAGFTNGVQIIVNGELYSYLLGDDSYSEIYPMLKENADADAFESWLDNWCSEQPGTHWLSYRQSSDEMAESFAQIKMLCWVLIAFIGVIGVLNIINTVYSNIHTRVGEIGMQRAIGMSAASLYKTFLWEGAYYGIFASVIGAVLGYACCIFVGAARTDALQLVAVPVMAIIEAAVVSVAACLLATAIPLRAIAKMNIVESIENVE